MKVLPIGDNRGLVDSKHADGSQCYAYRKLEGRVRVIPQTLRDIQWLTSLSHQNDRHAAAFGDGMLVRKSVLDPYLFLIR